MSQLTWNTLANNNAQVDESTTLRLAQWSIWHLVEMLSGTIGGLTAGVWTVDSSSDSVSAGAGDKWGGATFIPSKLVRNASGAHSWMALTAPAAFANNTGPWHLFVDWNTSTDAKCQFVFGQGAITPGTTTDRPTCSIEIVMTTGDTFAAVDTSKSQYQSLSLATTGEFWSFAHANSGGFTSLLGLSSIFESTAMAAVDTCPVTAFFAGGGVLATRLDFGFIATSCWSFIGSSNEYYAGQKHDGSGQVRNLSLSPFMTIDGSFNSNALFVNMSGVDSATGDNSDFYLPVYSVDGGSYRSLRGVLPDVSCGPTGLSVGAPLPTSTPYQVMTPANGVLFPWTANSGPIV